MPACQSQEDDITVTAAIPERTRVAAIPSGHPYVRAVCDPARVDLLADPRHPGAPDTQWWPPRMLDAGWIRTHAADFDVLHLHFGAESYAPEHVAAALRVARGAGRRVAFTVHDLENPQLLDQSDHVRMLDAVVPLADELITLTVSAQQEIRRRWGRHARVIAHPAMIDPDRGRPTGRARHVQTVGVHLRDLRPNIDAIGTVTTLLAAIDRLRGSGSDVDGYVHLNDRVRDPDTARVIERMLSSRSRVVLHRGDRPTDDELAASLADLDACVLPYAHGTHSGWVELCHDLAVPVIGPRVGHFAGQHPDDYHFFDRGDAISLARAIQSATNAASSRPGSQARAESVTARARGRRVADARIRAEHSEIYRAMPAGLVAA